jgi:hypothetical protein
VNRVRAERHSVAGVAEELSEHEVLGQHVLDRRESAEALEVTPAKEHRFPDHAGEPREDVGAADRAHDERVDVECLD